MGEGGGVSVFHISIKFLKTISYILVNITKICIEISLNVIPDPFSIPYPFKFSLKYSSCLKVFCQYP